MRYRLFLALPPVLSFSIDDVHPPMWTSPKSWSTPTPLSEGTCSSAVDIMAFHRDKMNEYLCRQFLAEEILEGEVEHHIQDRALPNLMEDTGSEGYKDWLARSTTLEDIYRHYEQSTEEDAPVGASLPPPDFDGEVTGYAMVGHNKVSDADSTGYGVGTTYGVPQYGGGSGGGGGHHAVSKAGADKGMKLQDLFQLALTAIAFLAFGTFITEVIMCLMGLETHPEEDVKLMIITPPEPFQAMRYENTDDGASRKSRSVKDQLDQLAARATASLDGIELIHRDGGKHLQRALCEANRYSKLLTGSRRMWLPLWSFGMSWIGGRQLAETSPSPFGTLKFLTSTIQGMAGVNCSVNAL